MSALSPETIEAWLKLVMPGLVIAGAAGYAIWQGWTRAAKAVSHAPNALIAADIMSTKPMADLASAVADLAHRIEHMTEAEERTAESNNRICAAIDRHEGAVRDLIRTVDRRLP